MEGAQNGTFLQSRRFLSYHPPGRFDDASLMFAMENGELLGVVPAARCMVDGRACFRAHPGSTFGGLVLAKHITQAERLLAMLDALETRLRTEYAACELKITPQLFATTSTALLEYALFNRGYMQEVELATYLPLAGATLEGLRAGYSATKRYELKRCETNGLTSRRITTRAELADFFRVLELNMQKFDTRPVHTLEELLDFSENRLRDEVRFVGVYRPEGDMVAGACLFYFAATHTLHTQYLATDTRVRGYAASAFLYDSVIRTGLEMGVDAVSFGTSTFEHGHVLNMGLIQNKEGYGCLHTLNRLFSKRFEA